jgi:hypothetical protein
MARPIRVVFKWNGGFVMRQASREENQQAQQTLMGIFETWKKDPGITYLCYYLIPGVGHRIVFEIENVDKLSEMDASMWQTKGTLLETYSFEVGLGNAEYDNWWTS